jgi:peptide/nickel transport system substrate-binding protein
LATDFKTSGSAGFALSSLSLMNIPSRFFILAAVLGLLIIGCGKSPSPAQRPRSVTGHPLKSAAVATCEPGVPGGRLTFVTVGVPQTFNPVLAGDSASDAIVRLLFSGLIVMDMTTIEPRAGLAESWSVAPDGRTWTFKLRAGLRWSDGEPLTADDVVFTWNDVMYKPDLNRATYDLFQIEGKRVSVSKLDDVTVRMETPTVFAAFLEFFGNVPILPRHVMAREIASGRFFSAYALSSAPDKVVGCGPFRLKEVQPAKAVLLDRNPEFWMVDKTGRRLPYIDEVLIEFGARGVPQQAFLGGHGDVCDSTRPEDFPAFQASLPSGKFQVFELGAGSERDFLWFNLNTNVNRAGQPLVPPIKTKWFQEKKFRQAVSCAIDRDQLVREAYGGRAVGMLTFVSNENPKWYNPNVPRFGYDPTRAKELLASIRIQDRNNDGLLEDVDGHSIEFTLLSNDGNPARQQAAITITKQLNQLGFKVSQQTIPYEALAGPAGKINSTFDYECILMGLGGGGLDPTAQSLVLKSSEPLHQWFPNQLAPATDWEARIDFLMDAQMRTLDFAERKKCFDEVQMILAEQLPMIYTITPVHFAAARPNLANLRPSVASPYRLTWSMEELYFKKP